jgi:hypothetical protein
MSIPAATHFRRYCAHLLTAACLTVPGLAGCQGDIGQGHPAGTGGSGAIGASTGGGGTPTGGTQGGGPGSGGSVGPGAGGSSGPGMGGAVGTGGTAAVPDPMAAACAAANGVLNVGVTKVRRLTRDQFNNTVRDLLGTNPGRPADALAPDERIGPFHSNAVAPITDLLVEQHQEIAAALATGAMSRMTQLSPCDLVADTGTTCATRFVTEFGRRAYRRPLTTAEITPYVNLFTLGRTGANAQNGFRLVVDAMLQSPFFLYQHDVGASGTPATGPIPVTAYELASRLSYFLWNSMPDPTLFDLAANGTLTQETVISAQVQRMLGDSKAAATIALFHRQWLAIDDLASREKDTTVYPMFSPALVDAMVHENAMFSDYVVRQGDGRLMTLFSSNLAFPQGTLFSLYGVSQPANFTVGMSVPLDATRRAGILTQAAFLTRHSHGNQTSPVHRGIVVRENLMCQIITPPPSTVNAVAPPVTSTTSTRQRFEQHSANPACADCHSVMDPIGLGFEHYDGIGAYRTNDGLGPVDARGEIVRAGPDLVGAFNGAIELSAKLAGSRDVQDCLTNQWFRFSLGRMESTNDACSIVAIRDGFRASGGNIRTLLAQIATSPAFRNVRATGN